MRKLLVMLILLTGFCACGCTLTQDANEHARMYNNITDLNMKMAVEDWDYIWLYDRSSALTQWHPRAGY